MLLPYLQSDNQTLNLLITKWKSILDPLLKNPANNSVLVQNVSLINGSNTINHTLGRTPQGWIICDITGAAQIYRSAPFNNLTLTLTSNSAVTVTLEVF